MNIQVTKCLVNNFDSYNFDAFGRVCTFNYAYNITISKSMLLLGLCHAVHVEEESTGGVAGGVAFC